MSLSRQLFFLALFNGLALLAAVALGSWRLADLREGFHRAKRDETVLYQLTEIKAAVLQQSRADLLSPQVAEQLKRCDELVRDRWVSVSESLNPDARKLAEARILGNWALYRKHYESALRIFASSPGDALSIPDSIYGLYLVPLTQELDQLVTARREAVAAQAQAIEAQTRNILWSVISPLIVAGGLVLSFQQRFGQRLRRQIEEYRRVAVRLADGDLSQRLPDDRNDEISALARATNKAISALEAMLREVKQSADKTELSASEIHGHSLDVTENVSQQVGQVRAVRTSIAEMDRSIGHIARSAGEAVGFSMRAAQTSSDAARVGEEASRRLLGVQEAIGQAGERLQVLQLALQKIGSISGLIKSVASQTNLLALNAAIEAARAGERGLGFAVVADEVRALSEHTTASTGQIDALLKDVSTSCLQMQQAMVLAAQTARDSHEQGGETLAVLGSVGETLRDVGRMLEGIAQATEDHSRETSAINAHIQSVAEIAENNASRIAHTETGLRRMMDEAGLLRASAERFQLSPAAA